MSTFKCDDIVIPIFDGSDYKIWKKRLTMFLKYKNCSTVIERERNANDSENTWTTNDIKATNFIYSTVSNKILEQISEEISARKMIVKLDNMFDKPSTALQIVVRSKLENLRLHNLKEIDSFF